MTTPKPPLTREDLEQKLIEKYMKVAAAFYYEGSDEETERSEYAPEFAKDILALFDQAHKRELLEARIDECEMAIGIAGMHLVGGQLVETARFEGGQPNMIASDAVALRKKALEAQLKQLEAARDT